MARHGKRTRIRSVLWLALREHSRECRTRCPRCLPRPTGPRGNTESDNLTPSDGRSVFLPLPCRSSYPRQERELGPSTIAAVNIAQAPPAPVDLGSWIAQLPPLVDSAVIAAVVSISIAIITNRAQGKRERTRDRELWDREDKHRFTNYKREIYSDYLAAVTDHRQHAIVQLPGIVEQVALKDLGEKLTIDRESFAELSTTMIQKYEEATLARGRILLVAPPILREKVNDLTDEIGGLHTGTLALHLIGLRKSLATLTNSEPASIPETPAPDEVFDRLQETASAIEASTKEVLDLMRRDIGS